MKSKAGQNAQDIEIELGGALDVKFALMEKLIDIFREAKEAGELDKWVSKVREESLINQMGCSETVADNYIKAALGRL